MIHSVSINNIRPNLYFGHQANTCSTHEHDDDCSSCDHDHHDHADCGHDHHDHSNCNHDHSNKEQKTNIISRMFKGITQRLKRVGTWFNELFSGLFKDIKKVLKGPDETHDDHGHHHH